MLVRIIKLGAYIGLPAAIVAFIICLGLIQNSPAMPQPERGLVVPIPMHGRYAYVTAWMRDEFYVSVGLLVLAMLCVLIVAIREGRKN